MAITYEAYTTARDALAALVNERAQVLPRRAGALRAWLDAGAAERWLAQERIVQGAREQDLALSMWWEQLWRRAVRKKKRRARQQRAQERNCSLSRWLGQAFRLAFRRGRVTAGPSIRHLPEKNVREGFFERPEFEAVLAALPADLRDLTLFAYLTGWRRGEVCSLRWTDVDLDGGAIRLRPDNAKTGRGRTVMLDPTLRALMGRRQQARLLERGSVITVADLVFHRDGAPVGDYRRAWASACIAGGTSASTSWDRDSVSHAEVRHLSVYFLPFRRPARYVEPC